MTRIPPSLLYLTIYNPTLRPSEPCDDEDAEEQAHILFYTSKERAVSRDRMLRQVGLAKALVNFSECDFRCCMALISIESGEFIGSLAAAIHATAFIRNASG